MLQQKELSNFPSNAMLAFAVFACIRRLALHLLILSFTHSLIFSQSISNNGAVINILAATEISNASAVNNSSGTISNAGIFSMTGTLTNDATMNGNGSYKIGGDWTNNNTFTAGTSTVTCNGASPQLINGSAVTDFNNLTIDGTGGVSLAQSATLKSTLTLTNGNFTTTGFDFTLISNISGTARMAAITGGSITGNIIMQRYIAAGNTSYRMLSSPVSGVTLAGWNDDFAMSGFTGTNQPTYVVSVYTYNEAPSGNKDVGFTAPTNVTNSIVEGKGYTCYVGTGPVTTDPITVDVTGAPYTGTVTLPTTFNDYSAPADDGWNLVGNPYASSIDWDAAGWTKTNIGTTFYIWSAANQNYASWTTGVGGLNGGVKEIASSQAFWVQASVGTPTLQVTEPVKIATDAAFLKTTPVVFTGDMVKLKISGSGFWDEMLVRFMPDATNSFEPALDARKMFSKKSDVPQITSVINAADLSVNSLNTLNSDTYIPVRAWTKKTGSYAITANSSVNIPSGYCVMLNDLQTGIITDLRSADYTFYSSDTSFSTIRFSLELIPSEAISCVTSVSNADIRHPASGIRYQVTGRQLEIYLPLNFEKATGISIYNAMGETVYQTSNYSNSITIDLTGFADGIYFFSVYLPESNFSQKFLLR